MKNMKIKYFFLILVLFANNAFSAESCFPENHLRFSPYDKSTNGISHYSYQELQNQVLKAFEKTIKEKYRKVLIFEDSWDNDKVNAYSTRDLNNNPVIKIMGGMARHPELSKDGFLLIVCHELGHYMGGAPKALRGNSEKLSWSSIEGQSDYFATSKCLPRIFKNHIENREIIKSAPSKNLRKAQARCGLEDALCIRVAMAALSVSKVFHSLREFETYPDLEKIDQSVAYVMEYGHPSPQCRLDTFLNGINCKDKHQIMFDNKNPTIGSCVTKNAERPRCWYRP
ncbi:MAG: hypothetical protein DRQ88_13075 [Epsilonproteobacteria bacterium]|nr:MAG: hypothetical protein DRQ88_13075 [Campylobacterota bacterium]RLA62950.1 MAG: hypothetical protein DRQ89_08230 [Campylobacterota bacterium]